MNSRYKLHPVGVVVCGAIMLASAQVTSQPAKPIRPQSQPQSQPQSVPAEPWTSRLESLRPDRPEDYFDLAEEMADAAVSNDQKIMARHLFALAGVLDSRHLGRSACLALADLEIDILQKKRLLALAALLDPAGASTDVAGLTARPAEALDVVAVVAVCDAFSRYRRGQGSQALAALKKPGATELLEAHASILPGGLPRFLEDCKQLRGTRPNLSEDDINKMLRLESLLLSGAERSWATELSLHGKGQPLLEIDPDHLDETFGIDARRPVYRNGRWVEK